MSELPAKRRKMRPNNAIAIQRAKAIATQQEKSTKLKAERENSIKARPMSTPKSTHNKDVSSASDSDETDRETENPVSKTIPAKRRFSKDDNTPLPKRNWTKNQKNTSIPASDSNNPIKKESSLKEVVPVVQPMSASDSDESDKEELPIAQSKSNSETNKVAKSQQQSKAAGPSNSALASDESVVEKPAASKLKKKPLPKSQLKKTTKPVRNTPSSASDSDETDTERKQPTKKSKNQAYSASDSDETDRESKQPAAKNDKQSSSGESSSDESSSNETDPSSNNKSKSFRDLAKKKDHLVANRISFRRKLDYDPDRPAASKFKNRLVDDFVPKVNNEEFISDSDSETDSGEDYDSREYPSWQRGLGGNRHANTDPWPKPRKFGYSDKLNLEKRIKKICKRENMTFEEAQEIFSSSHRKEHLRFFQKIGKAFPDISLHMLAKQCKEMYHIKRNNSPWTQEEIDKLDLLRNTLGSSTRILSEHLNRSPKNINDFLYSRKNATKKLNKPWTEEEDKVLAKAAAKIKTKEGARMSFLSIEPLFKGERSQRQIYARYYLIRHRIRPDGTLEGKRKATPYEELKYLKNLMAQVDLHNLIEESQLDFAKGRGYVYPQFYLNSRANIKGFEKMKIKDILQKLISRQNEVIKFRKDEGLLGSDQESH